MSLEVHCQTRESLKPNPKFDEITAVFYCIQNQSPPNSSVPEIIVCAIIVEKVDGEPFSTPPRSGSKEGSSKSIFSNNSKSSNFKTEIKYGTRDLPLFGCDCLPNNSLNVTTVACEKDLFDELVNVMKRLSLVTFVLLFMLRTLFDIFKIIGGILKLLSGTK